MPKALRHSPVSTTVAFYTGDEAMGFKRDLTQKVVAFVLLSGSLALAAPGEADTTVTVRILNRAGVSRHMLETAEGEAARIFRAAGIDIVWNDCSVTHQCQKAPGMHELVLSIVNDGRTLSDLTYGVAFLDPDGNGKYADVFFRRVEAAYRIEDGNVARLLGTVAAHELGHLLLGAHAHSFTGVMLPSWKNKTLRDVRAGSLLFTSAEAALMRSRISSGSGIRATTEFTLVRGLGDKP